MTWGRALPVLVLCGVFDALRIFFEQLWYFGPKALSTQTGSAVSSIVGFVTAPEITIFGIIMAMALGVAGSGTVLLVLAITDSRIFTNHPINKLLFQLGLGISVAPLLGTAPALVVTTFFMYRAQIKKETSEARERETERAEEERRRRNEQAAHAMEEFAARMAGAEAAGDAEEIPGEEREAA